jgi:hypothetical protein
LRCGVGRARLSAQNVIAGYEQLIVRAHQRGLRIIGATLTPLRGHVPRDPLYGYYDDAKEAKREAINDWIRTSSKFDGVIDFDQLTKDAADPKHVTAEYDKGDHLHRMMPATRRWRVRSTSKCSARDSPQSNA